MYMLFSFFLLFTQAYFHSRLHAHYMYASACTHTHNEHAHARTHSAYITLAHQNHDVELAHFYHVGMVVTSATLCMYFFYYFILFYLTA